MPGELQTRAPQASGTRPTRGARLRALFPAEKGSWAALYEPLLLCLLLAPTVPTVALFVAGLAAFLARQPVRAMFVRGRGANREMVSALVVLAIVGALGLATALLVGAADSRCVAMLAAGAALGGLYFALDARKQGRSLLGELAGAMAPLTLAPVALWLSGADRRLGVVALALLILRHATTIFYVRYRLRVEKRQPARLAPSVVAHAAGLAAAALLVRNSYLDATGFAAYLLLLARYIVGVMRPAGSVTAKQLGFTEIAVGLLYTILAALGAR